MRFFVVFLQLLVISMYVVLAGRVLMSWINPRFDGPVARFLYETTEPFLAPIRRMLPQTGMVDFSPLIAFLLLGFLSAFILR